MRRLTPVLLLALAGCGAESSEYDATVQGTVTVDDQLAPGGTVVFSPEVGGPDAVGIIGTDGSYSLRIGRGDPSDPDYSGIPSGNYVATVAILGPSGDGAPVAAGGPPTAGPRLIADRYTDKKTSDLKYAVNEGVNIIVLKLDGPWANPPVEEEQEDDEGEQSDEEAMTDDGAQEVASEAEGAESTPADKVPTASDVEASESPSSAPHSSEEPATTSQQTPAEEQPQ